MAASAAGGGAEGGGENSFGAVVVGRLGRSGAEPLSVRFGGS